jgi:integrase
MLTDGVPVEVVSELLGHASTSITMDTDAHALPGTGAAAGAQL